jgi:cytochrome c-type biogenesis protein CcmF
MLYMGYVGFSVAFSFAIAALLSGKLDAAWARWSRPWTTTAWIFLTLGIALGSWWAYYELGWGGWWFWDPVENASFLPWLVGTALLHSLAVTEKRGSFKNWTVLLAIGAFSLSLLGTFLVRSGVLTSVHAFATDPRRGIFILILLALVVGSSLTLFAWRAAKVSLGGSFGLVSRETLLLVNNVLLVVAAGSVLLGTLYPLIIDALNLGKLSVGPPYFNAVFVPIMVPLLFLLGAGPLARWKHASVRDIAQRLVLPGILALLAGAAVPHLMGGWTLLTGIGMLLALWIAASVVMQTVARVKSGSPPPSYWGMQLGHLGVAVFVVGVTMVGGYQEEKDVRMEPGDTVSVGGYEFKFIGVTNVAGPNYKAARGEFEVSRNGRFDQKLFPEKRNYFSSTMPMTEAAIDAGFTRDVYVSLGEPLEGAAWAARVYYKPFVDWIWGGCLLMALGGFVAVTDRRYRLRVKSVAVTSTALQGATR